MGRDVGSCNSNGTDLCVYKWMDTTTGTSKF